MYAVVRTGGKQYKAEVGQVLIVEKLDVPTGEEVRFDQVLLISTGDSVSVGTPLVEGATVVGKVVRQDRGPKIIVFKYKPKVRYRRKTGHRQYQTQVLVETITSADGVLARRTTAARAEAPVVDIAEPAPVVMASSTMEAPEGLAESIEE